MLHLARLSTRRPLAAFFVWFAVAAALAAIGLGVSHSLSPTIVVVPGSETARAEQLAESNFGPSVLVPVLLEGPKAQLDQQGPALVRALAARRDTRVLSAWDIGDTGGALRPDATHAMIVASVGQTERAMVDGIQKQIDRIVDQQISAPVTSYITGTPTIDLATKDQSLDAARRAELLALPILFFVLLVILRAPIAALVLTAFGGMTTLMSFGAMALLGKAIDVDPTAVTLASMSGLALGVSYALLVYRRWRTERSAIEAHDRAGEAFAATRAVETAGRAVLIGGTALVVTLGMAPLIAPNTILISLGIGATLCSALAIGGAVVVMPAVMIILGPRLQAFAFGLPAFLLAPWIALANRGGGWVVRNAMGAGAVATALLLVLALPATSLKTGPISPSLLPKDDPARVSYEKISAVMGPGFATPFNIVVVSKDKPITDRAMLRKLDAFQAKIAADPRVESVVGPGDLYTSTADLKKLPKQLNGSKKMLKTAPAGLKTLEAGLGTAGSGSEQLRSGIAAAAAGAQQLASGSGQASSGSAQLHAGLATAQAGAAKISSGLGAAVAGAKKLHAGAGQLQGGTSTALGGAKQIAGGLGQAVSKVKPGVPVVQAMAGDVAASAASVDKAAAGATSTATQINAAASQLKAMQVGTDDPAYHAAIAALGQASASAAATTSSINAAASKLGPAANTSAVFAEQVAALSAGLEQLYGGSKALSSGIAQLNAGAGQLASGQGDLVAGMQQLNTGGGALNAGLQKLTSGAGDLESGLNKLSSGNGQLASGLSAAPGQIDPLISGLDKMQVAVAKFRGQLPSAKDIEQLQASSPGLFNSGYFVLAAVAGSPASSRNQAASVVNLHGGGTAGMIMVVPEQSATTPTTQDLGKHLVTMSGEFAAATKTEAAVGGSGGALGDFDSEGSAKVWPVVIGESIVVLLMLVVMLRAVVLPAIAVAFDLLTAAATFGILTLLYSGSDALLSGPGYIDPISIIGIFAFIFGVSMVYEVALLYRTREAFLETGDAHEAVKTGLVQTAAAATGAAAVMLAAIIPFATVDLLSVQVFGVGVAIAILLDALIVRPVLLPAAASLLGRWSWWPLSRQAPPTPPHVPTVPPERPIPSGRVPVGA
ncbi:MAG TPA: MMPL family transporter [Solirubrobacteraceae bacterium]|nr:MMPL family transporter [Solirubrobacteraceae bacterium]